MDRLSPPVMSLETPFTEESLRRPGLPSTSRRLDLVEHQAKALLTSVSIPTLPAQLVRGVEDLRSLTYPLRLKSQVHWSNCQALGGVIQVNNRLDAIAACQTLLHRAIRGEYPGALLAEPVYLAGKTLQVTLSARTSARTGSARTGDRAPSLLLSGSSLPSEAQGATQDLTSRGGARSPVQVVPIEISAGDRPREQGLALGQCLGLQGPALQALGDVVDKMHDLFSWANIKFLSLSPLEIRADGQVLALDVQVRFASPAKAWQCQLENLLLPSRSAPPLVHLEGNIGVLGSSVGRTLATVEQLKQAGGQAAAFVAFQGASDVPRPAPTPLTPQANMCLELHQQWQRHQYEQITQALYRLSRLRDVRVIVVNWRGLSTSCCTVAEALLSHLRLTARPGPVSARPVPLVVRLTGTDVAAGLALLEGTEVTVAANLEAAIAPSIGLSRLPRPCYTA